eukprot:210360-Hanusia_phi.AAC.4
MQDPLPSPYRRQLLVHKLLRHVGARERLKRCGQDGQVGEERRLAVHLLGVGDNFHPRWRLADQHRRVERASGDGGLRVSVAVHAAEVELRGVEAEAGDMIPHGHDGQAVAPLLPRVHDLVRGRREHHRGCASWEVPGPGGKGAGHSREGGDDAGGARVLVEDDVRLILPLDRGVQVGPVPRAPLIRQRALVTDTQEQAGGTERELEAFPCQHLPRREEDPGFHDPQGSSSRWSLHGDDPHVVLLKVHGG